MSEKKAKQTPMDRAREALHKFRSLEMTAAEIVPAYGYKNKAEASYAMVAAQQYEDFLAQRGEAEDV